MLAPLPTQQAKAYSQALTNHQAGEFYLAHTHLEEVLWVKEPHRVEQLLWQTCLQATVSAHHAQQGNGVGAARLRAKAQGKAKGFALLYNSYPLPKARGWHQGVVVLSDWL